MKRARSPPNGQKTLWEKEELHVTSNFSFTHSVFKRLVLQTCKNKSLFGKGLTPYQRRTLTHVKIQSICRRKIRCCSEDQTSLYKSRKLSRKRRKWGSPKFPPIPTIFSKLFIPFPKKALVLTYLQYKSFKNTVGKGEIGCNEQFLLFPTMFSTLLENYLPFSSNFKLSSLNSSNLEKSTNCHLGKG